MPADKEKPKSITFAQLLDMLPMDNEEEDDAEDTPNLPDPLVPGETHQEQAPYPFPYRDYTIIGDTAIIDKVINTWGIINISIPDITSTLSVDTVNYVTEGYAEGLQCFVNALKDALGNLPIEIDSISNILINIWHSRSLPSTVKMKEMKSLANYLKILPDDMEIVWGNAVDNSLDGLQAKVSLIAACK